MQLHEIFVKEESELNYYLFYFFNSVKNKNFVKSASTGSNITPINYLPFFHRDPKPVQYNLSPPKYISKRMSHALKN